MLCYKTKVFIIFGNTAGHETIRSRWSKIQYMHGKIFLILASCFIFWFVGVTRPNFFTANLRTTWDRKVVPTLAILAAAAMTNSVTDKSTHQNESTDFEHVDRIEILRVTITFDSE